VAYETTFLELIKGAEGLFQNGPTRCVFHFGIREIDKKLHFINNAHFVDSN
jgi:hypothetical protein